MVAIMGKKVRMSVVTRIAIRNGVAPLNISFMGTSLTIPAMVYTFRPTGGVINPAFIMRTQTTPNQIGSKFKANHNREDYRHGEDHHGYGVKKTSQDEVNANDY